MDDRHWAQLVEFQQAKSQHPVGTGGTRVEMTNDEILMTKECPKSEIPIPNGTPEMFRRSSSFEHSGIFSSFGF
jgi:hypothetical protein